MRLVDLHLWLNNKVIALLLLSFNLSVLTAFKLNIIQKNCLSMQYKKEVDVMLDVARSYIKSHTSDDENEKASSSPPGDSWKLIFLGDLRLGFYLSVQYCNFPFLLSFILVTRSAETRVYFDAINFCLVYLCR